MSFLRTVCTLGSIIPAMYVGAAAGGLVAGGASAITSAVAEATGSTPESASNTVDAVAGTVGLFTGVFVTCKIVGCVYSAFDE